MQSIIFILSILLLGFINLSAQDINGAPWEGYLDQSAAAAKMSGYQDYWKKGLWKKGDKTHNLKMTFKYNEKQKAYIGEYYINEKVNPAHYARFAIRATITSKNKVRYTTTSKVFETKNTLNVGFCYNSATLNYSEDEQYEYLEGSWRGWNDDFRACAAAHIWLRRPKEGYVPPTPPPPPPVEEKETPKEAVEPKIDSITIDTIVEMPTIEDTVVIDTVVTLPIVTNDRKQIIKENMTNNKDSITIEIWDGNRADGDIISLSFNGRVLLKQHELTNTKRSFRVALKKGENILELFAHNLGEIPPNTAAISIEREGGHKVITLESDMDKSEAIRIMRE